MRFSLCTSLHVIGASSTATGVPSSRPTFGADLTETETLRSNAIRSMATAAQGALHQAVSTAFVDALDVGKALAPVVPDPIVATGELSERMEVAAPLLNADLGFRVLLYFSDGTNSDSGAPALSQRSHSRKEHPDGSLDA